MWWWPAEAVQTRTDDDRSSTVVMVTADWRRVRWRGGARPLGLAIIDRSAAIGPLKLECAAAARRDSAAERRRAAAQRRANCAHVVPAHACMRRIHVQGLSGFAAPVVANGLAGWLRIGDEWLQAACGSWGLAGAGSAGMCSDSGVPWVT